ncbi:MAG: type I DNA topoisomerase [Bacteroidota bacterium]
MQLLIVESPTKAATLAHLLGDGYRVRATEGHIVDLPDGDLGVDTEETFEPTWKTAKGKRGVLAGLRRDAEGCDRILLATDPDREGEAIAQHLADALARTGVATARVALAEITAPAVRAALRKPRRVNHDLVAAQQARRVVDRLVGYAVSPVLQRAVAIPRSLSAGRVQTAALRLLCEREQALADFVPADHWHVEATFRTAAGEAFTARLRQAYGAAVAADTIDEGAAWHLAETVQAMAFTVRTVRQATEPTLPPPPFTTAAFLRAASRHLGLAPARAMRVAQQLYEGVELENDERAGLLTYPRTDSVHMAKAAVAAARDLVARDFGPDYLPPRPHRHKQAAARGAQEAHEALRPSDFDRAPKRVRKYLSPEQYRVYELVYRRAVASQTAAAVRERTTVDLADAAGQFIFRAEGRRFRTRGFLQFEQTVPADAPLPASLSERAAVELGTVTHGRQPAAPPERYTEAALVGAMEAHRLGRPSTYAATLSTLAERGYATIRDGRLHPTDLGLRACSFLVQRFPRLFDLRFTVRMEATLDAVAAGQVAYRPVLQEFYHGSLVPALQPPAVSGRIAEPVPGRTGSAPACDRCGKPMVRRDGPHGPFYGCSSFPVCRETRALEQA